MIPAPETAAQMIGEMLQPFLDGKKTNPLDLQRIKHEIDKLMNADPGVAHVYLGYLAAIKRDKAGVIKYFENALKLDGETYSHLTNYAQALDFCNEREKALSILHTAMSLNCDLNSVDLGIKISDELNDDESLEFFISKRASLCEEEPDLGVCFVLDRLEDFIDKRPDLVTPMDEDLFEEALALVEGMESE
ncbi:hypothetical protein [Maridesulfovibrio sp.]|uniref:hypothetical protein n=1 Tax=Maridesulfovibrio sp. TaxID=2795000 RepID=UPI0029F510AD|nr:hypothetical protein [Maridesulfovibrio sp.]